MPLLLICKKKKTKLTRLKNILKNVYNLSYTGYSRSKKQNKSSMQILGAL